MKIANLSDLYTIVDSVLQEYGIKDDTLFVGVDMKRFKHRKDEPVEIGVDCSWFTNGNCESVLASTPEELVNKIRARCMGKQKIGEPLQDIEIS